MDKGTSKRLKLSELDKTTRAKRGLLLMKEIKSNPSQIIKVYIENTKNNIFVKTNNEVKELKLNEIPIMDRYSNGSFIVKDKIIDTYNIVSIDDIKEEVIKEEVVVKKQDKVSFKEIADKFMTIDDLLDNIEKK